MKKIRYKTVLHAVLEKIGELGIAYLDAMFAPQYSFTKSGRILFGLDKYPKKIPASTFRSVISRLKKAKLISNHKTDNSGWKITTKGKEWLLERNSFVIPDPDGIRRLVVFDIPERERRKRDRVRSELVSCGFKQLQKSVWMGETPLPEDFIDLLDTLRLKDRVHMLSIKNTGTINTKEE